MKSICSIFAISAAALGVFSQGRESTRWKEYVPSDGSFGVTMPGTPERSTEKVYRGPLGTIDGTAYVSEPWFGLSGIGYGVLSADIPSAGPFENVALSWDGGLAGVREAILTEFKGRILHERPLTLAGYPAHEFEAEVEVHHQRRVAIVRCALVGRRLYVVMIAHRIGREISREKSAFFDSFRVAGSQT